MNMRYLWLRFTILVLSHLAVAYGTGMAPFPSGKRQTCLNEGEPVITQFDPNIFACICKNGYVECANMCPSIEDCLFVVDVNKYCKICKGCTYKGISYRSHTEWTDPANPCKVLRCEAGIVTVTDLHCYTSCPNPRPPEPGKCCSTCSVCQINGQEVAENRDVVSEDDPCLKCRCSKGNLTCSKKACPVLQCSHRFQYKAPGECCPRCNGTKELIQLEGTCAIQSAFLKANADYKPDKCTNCKCVNSTAVCIRSTCPILDCAPDLQKTFTNHCCPTCIKPSISKGDDEFNIKCYHGDRTYEDGDVWSLDVCSSCECHDGKVKCARIKCNTTCAAGVRMINVSGECCPKCIESEGACMVFGDPHYKTFDGKMYDFKGIGKYQLIEDCHNNTFSIRVANEQIRQNDSTTTKRVAINFGNIRLNLQQRRRVKYNGNRIKLPYKKEGQFRVNILPDAIEVRLQNDVVILWNGKSFLEVTVPPTYKGKLCGLCGNFNGDVQDDLRTKAGQNVSDKDLLSFGSSWCIGKKEDCAKKIKTNLIESYSNTACQALTRSTFAPCEQKLSIRKYQRACKMDMSTCKHGKCYCDSFMAYSRECERLGVKLMNWQKHTNCDSHSSKRKTSHKRMKNHRHHSSSQSFSSEELHAQTNQLRLRSRLSYSARNPIPIH